jgi:hypothetical protein
VATRAMVIARDAGGVRIKELLVVIGSRNVPPCVMMIGDDGDVEKSQCGYTY